MNRIFLFALLLASWKTAPAQTDIRVEKQGVATSFILEKNDYPGTLTVFLDLKDVYNSDVRSGQYKFEVRDNNKQLLTLRAQDESYDVGYSYAWSYFQGRLDPRVDTTFLYRMPTSAGKPVRVIEAVYVIDYYNRKDKEAERLGFTFPVERGDTVYAMRRGRVVKVECPEKKVSANMAVSLTTETPSMLIEQADGTFAWYICLDPASLLVGPGDDVLPGTPLALAGNYDGEHHQFSVQIWWYLSQKDKDGSFRTKRYMPRFATTDGNLVPCGGQLYTPVMNDALLTAEMSKREIKSLAGGSKK